MRAWARMGILVAAAFAAAIACGNDPLGAARVGVPSDDAGAFVDGAPAPSLGSDTGDAGGCPIHCSTDLHSVLDCNDAVLSTCPDDTGCAAGACVDPCAAARANGSAQGCEFYGIEPAIYLSPLGESDDGSCFAAMLTNTWSKPITIQADYGGTALDVAKIARVPNGSGSALTYDSFSGVLAPGALAILFLAGDGKATTPCPTGIDTGVPNGAQAGTARMHAFHITTSAPAAAYDVFPYGGATSYVTSATLLIPTSAWGTNYVAADGYAPAASSGELPFLQLAAAQDGTSITIRPTQDVVGGGGVDPASAQQPHTYTLGRGEVLQLAQEKELAGSIIASDKPIGVWGGDNCMNIPLGQGACDSAHQQLLPVSALGSDYVGARYRDRYASVHETTPWTITAMVDHTVLKFEPVPLGVPATLTLSAGEVREINAADPFRVTSDDEHPFHFAAHMTGANAVSSDVTDGSAWGDPEWVTSVPTAQWLPSYVFLTDPTYKNTHLVLVRRRVKDGSLKDVTLDCVGVIGGWTVLSNGSPFEVARVDISIAGAYQGACADGVHTAKSDAPFALTVWGWDDFVSYAFPAGMSVRPINTVVVPPVK